MNSRFLRSKGINVCVRCVHALVYVCELFHYDGDKLFPSLTQFHEHSSVCWVKCWKRREHNKTI